MKSNEIENNNNFNSEVNPNEFVQSPIETQVQAPQQVQPPPINQAPAQTPSWVDAHSNNEILQGTLSEPPTVKEKKKIDFVKWGAVALASLFAATTVISVSALSKSTFAGSTLTGTVTAVNGNSITISLGSAQIRNGFDMQGGMMQGAPPDMQGNSENSQNNKSDNSQSESSQNSNSQSETSESSDSQFSQDSDKQIPNGNMSPPDMNNMQGGMQQGKNESSSGEVTVKTGITTTITEGTEKISADDIEVGDSVTVTFGSFGSTKEISVTQSNTNNQDSFGSIPDGNFQQNQSDSSESQ